MIKYKLLRKNNYDRFKNYDIAGVKLTSPEQSPNAYDDMFDGDEYCVVIFHESITYKNEPVLFNGWIPLCSFNATSTTRAKELARERVDDFSKEPIDIYYKEIA